MRKPSPSMVVAVTALVVALSGTAVAAQRYVVTSTKQISPKVLKALRGARGTRGPAGPGGATGAIGPSGERGLPGQPGQPGLPGGSGTNGTNGTNGIDGSARAYVRVTSAGVVVPGQSKGITASRMFAGIYCLTVAGGLTPDNAIVVATPEYGNSASNQTFLQSDNAGITFSCAPGQFQLDAHNAAGNLVDTGFTALVP